MSPEFLMAGGAKIAAFAGKSQQVFMAAVFTLHTGKAVVQVATIEIPVESKDCSRIPE